MLVVLIHTRHFGILTWSVCCRPLLYPAAWEKSQQHHLELQRLLLPNSEGVSSLAKTPLSNVSDKSSSTPGEKVPVASGLLHIFTLIVCL